mmetsp:Transcript_7363/g.10411  ORF Transcript_7363/g.10411 Transcript_7363/m.10411 type:complete len:191 (-) Transcript_7363:116-688(-)
MMPYQPILLYRLEQFESELQRLSVDLGEPKLFQLYKSFKLSDLAPHSSSLDEFNVSLSAKSFLAHASSDAMNYFFPHYEPGQANDLNDKNSTAKLSSRPIPIPNEENIDSYRASANTYLVAVCRLLLSDFLCADYDLPQDCAFLLQEAKLWMALDHSDDDEVEKKQEELECHKMEEGSSEICSEESCWLI